MRSHTRASAIVVVLATVTGGAITGVSPGTRAQEAAAARTAITGRNREPGGRVEIPAGLFRMGATGSDLQRAERLCTAEFRAVGALNAEIGPRCRPRFDVEGPAVEVFVSAFAIDRTEVTFAEVLACAEAGGCARLPDWLQRQALARPDHPAEAITFFEAVRFCRQRGGRLPTEAEWERAARGLGRRFYPWGDSEAGGQGPHREARANHGRARVAPWHDGDLPASGGEDDRDGFPRSAPVGSFPRGASPYGVLDLAGNVWEWTSGIFSRQMNQPADAIDPQGSLFGSERTVRGGSYLASPAALRTTARVALAPTERALSVGFRCAYGVGKGSDR